MPEEGNGAILVGDMITQVNMAGFGFVHVKQVSDEWQGWRTWWGFLFMVGNEGDQQRSYEEEEQEYEWFKHDDR